MNVTSARQLLGVRSSTPSIDEVRGAWRQFALKNHPDMRPEDPTAAGRFSAGRAAYESLASYVAGTPPTREPITVDSGVYRPSSRPGRVLRGVDAAAVHPYAFSHVTLREWRA